MHIRVQGHKNARPIVVGSSPQARPATDRHRVEPEEVESWLDGDTQVDEQPT